MVDLNAIAALLLRHVARHIGRPQRRLHGIGFRDVHETNTCADTENAAIPDESQFLHGKPETFGRLHCNIGVAIPQQDAKLVASQSRQQAVAAEIFLQQCGRLFQQLISRGMTTCIVDDLELVEIEKHQGMPAGLMGQPVERIAKAGFEFATVDQSCQGVVRCLPGQTRDEFPLGRLKQPLLPQHLARVPDNQEHE